MSINVYPVIKTEDVCNDYRVLVNGKEAELNTARVSAHPFNRRWPGHQRQKNQSELINFLSFETDEKVEFEIIPKNSFEKVEVRPKSLGIVPEVTSDGHIKFSLEKPAYFTVEPYGRHNALHVFADPVKKYDVDINDENVIYYGKGEHDVGNIVLKSGQTLFLDEGAVVYSCIYAEDAKDIKILGRGILDNSKNKEEILFEINAENNDADVRNAKRQHTVRLEYCENIEIDGITIRDSLVYNIRPICCQNLDIRNVKIIGCWRYNSDGIDMHNCENVEISDCFIRTFDDSICIKGFDFYQNEADMLHNGRMYDVFRNAHISNCTIWNDWGKSLEIGAETRAREICDIVFENCDIIHVTGPVLDCYNVDYADVHDLVYRNINVEYDDVILKSRIQKNDEETYVNPGDENHSPYLLSSIVEFHKEYSAGGTIRGKNRRITFENISLYGKQRIRLAFTGSDMEHKSSDIKIINLRHNGERITDFSQTDLIMTETTENITIE